VNKTYDINIPLGSKTQEVSKTSLSYHFVMLNKKIIHSGQAATNTTAVEAHWWSRWPWEGSVMIPQSMNQNKGMSPSRRSG